MLGYQPLDPKCSTFWFGGDEEELFGLFLIWTLYWRAPQMLPLINKFPQTFRWNPNNYHSNALWLHTLSETKDCLYSWSPTLTGILFWCYVEASPWPGILKLTRQSRLTMTEKILEKYKGQKQNRPYKPENINYWRDENNTSPKKEWEPIVILFNKYLAFPVIKRLDFNGKVCINIISSNKIIWLFCSCHQKLNLRPVCSMGMIRPRKIQKKHLWNEQPKYHQCNWQIHLPCDVPTAYMITR